VSNLVYYCRGRTYNEENLFEDRALMKWRECGGSCMITSKRMRSVGHVARMGGDEERVQVIGKV
jgi:hypothetical protein